MTQIREENSLFDCVGSIVASQYVITAAHCVKDVPLAKMALEFNSTSTKWVSVSYVLIHPLYDDTTYVYDIALLKTTGHMDISKYTPICLPSLLDEIRGRRPYYGRKAEIVVYRGGHQKTVYGRLSFHENESLICTFPDEETKEGDSGGPLMVHKEEWQQQYTLIGDASHVLRTKDREYLQVRK